ncbi:MAG: DUF177 domain-containing protein [Caldilineae bacterium]|nr:MAG: DUF177 domain-containing protein [Caldilineae bacterium]
MLYLARKAVLPVSEKSSPRRGQTLQFNVAQLLKQPAEAARHFTFEDAIVPHLEQELTLRAPLHGHINLVKTGADVLVTGTLSTELELPCTRCLTPVRVPVTVDIEETFSPTHDVTSGARLTLAADADPATLIDEHHILNLAEVVRQDLLLSQPSHVLCRPQCAGLCPQCGHNLNEGPCACQPDEVDARWAGLLALKEELEAEKSSN